MREYLESVLRVPGRCLEGFWKVLGKRVGTVSGCYLEGVWKLLKISSENFGHGKSGKTTVKSMTSLGLNF